MSSDLRYLIFLNMTLVAITAYGAFVSFRKSEEDPKWHDSTSIQAKIEQADADELRDLASTLAAGLKNRVGAVRSDRKHVGILLGFAALVAGTNLWLIFWLYRKSRRGLYIQDGVMLKTE